MGSHPVRGPSDWIRNPELEEEPVNKPLELAGIQVDRNKYPALQQNAAETNRFYPNPWW